MVINTILFLLKPCTINATFLLCTIKTCHLNNHENFKNIMNFVCIRQNFAIRVKCGTCLRNIYDNEGGLKKNP